MKECFPDIEKNNHLFLADKLNIFIGKIKSIKKYYAICLIKKEFEEREIEIEKENLNNAYINDTVRVQLKSNNTGVVLNVLKHDLWHLVVEYQNKKFVYDDKFFPYKLQILNNKKFHLVNGHIILLKVKKYNKSNLECEIEKILGHHNDPGIDILEMIYKSGVPNEFSEQFINKTNDYLNNKKIPNYYLLKLLKKTEYKKIINHYCLGGARADLKLDWLKKIQKESVSKNIKIVLNEENLGYASGNNVGIRLAKGQNVVLLNNDTLVSDGWLEQIVAPLANSKVGLVGPITNRIGSMQQVTIPGLTEANYERLS